jgi:hypothetical protein
MCPPSVPKVLVLISKIKTKFLISTIYCKTLGGSKLSLPAFFYCWLRRPEAGKKELKYRIYPELDEGFNPSRKKQTIN